MRNVAVCAGALALALSACAGRDPQPIATSQVQDSYASCAQIQAEIQANNTKVQALADEQGLKVAQNVTAGVVGLVIWPVWFAMDFKGAASKEVTALQARQQYLAILATERCAPAGAPPRRTAGGRHAPHPSPQPLPVQAYSAPAPVPAVPEPPPPPQVPDRHSMN